MTRVAPEDPDLIVSARQIAAELHALAFDLAFSALDEAALHQMEQANDRLSAALAAGDAEAAIAADDDFHEVALDRCANPLIPEHLEVVTATLRRAEFLHFESVKGSASPEQHIEIISAVRAGNQRRGVALTRANWSTITGQQP